MRTWMRDCYTYKNDTGLTPECKNIFRTTKKKRRFCGPCENKLFELGKRQKDYMRETKNYGLHKH